MQLAVIDYKINNIGSLLRSLELCGGTPFIATSGEDLKKADKIVLPGVGSFGDGMLKLKEYGFISALKEAVLKERKPILGICLGMQLFAAKGFESGEQAGLGFFDEVVDRLEQNDHERLPHMGWNSIQIKKESALLENIPNGADFYFVHSYGIKSLTSQQGCIATVDYGGGFAAIMEQENIFGVQFHPEKSFPLGFQVLKNFLKL